MTLCCGIPDRRAPLLESRAPQSVQEGTKLILAELQQLRDCIKRDVREVVQVELEKIANRPAWCGDEPRAAELTPQHASDPDAEESADLLASACLTTMSRQTGRISIAALQEAKAASGIDLNKMKQKWAGEHASLRAVQRLRDVYPGQPMKSVFDAVEWVLKLREPPREGPLAAIVHSRACEGCFTIVILLNVLYMVFQVNYTVLHPNDDLPSQFETIDRAFLIAYSVEMILKFIVHRLYLFWCPDMGWHMLDLALIGHNVFEEVLAHGAVGHDAKWVRVLRMLRIAKVLRVLRVVRSFSELQLIMNCILGSFMSMIWSVVMLFIAFCVFSLVLVQQTGSYLAEDSAHADDADLLQTFGAVEVAMWTLFKATFGGDDWAVYYIEVEKLGKLARGVWFFFIVFTQIALLNILTGIFVQNALQLAEGDAQLQALQHEETNHESAHQLRVMCEEYDDSGDGILTKEEFKEMAESEEFARYLSFIGLDLRNAEDFFDFITEDDEAISIQAFVAGCMALRGYARSSDLMSMMMEVKKTRRMTAEASEEVLEHLQAIQARINGRICRQRTGDVDFALDE